MDLTQIAIYVVGTLLMIIGYFLKDKSDNLEKQVVLQASQISTLEKDLLKVRIDSAQQFVSRVEFSDTINRVFNKLDDIQKDIRHIRTLKQDDENSNGQ